VVIGSSSIYPIFPSRRLDGVGDIVDGGFAHNSPIEAAWMWKATHIILIEASPRPATRKESHLWQNAQNAFNHLYYQAQLSDLRLHGKVEMFILRPEEGTEEEPGMCTFDFNPKAIKGAIDQGELDASGIKPRFERVHGEPVFEEIDFEESDVKNEVAPCPCSNNPVPGDSSLAGNSLTGPAARLARAPRPRRN
jgi:predicted acylesterase/phospholipase RssA